ncbi:hypothetical protein LUR56_39750 [Streptomyces sp. MT29]|nr:hypothetical protein [Streptomyces sp. MT29]
MTNTLTAAARSVATALGPSAEHLAPALTCFELDEMLDLFAAVGDTATAAKWIEWHGGTDEDDECTGHSVPDLIAAPAERPQYAENGEHTPEPGTEYPFSVSDITRAVSALLGDDWFAESGTWGTTGSLSGPYTASFTFKVDHDGDLLMTFDRMTDDGWPEAPTLPEDFYDGLEGVHLTTACSADGLEHLAVQYAAAVRAITGH